MCLRDFKLILSTNKQIATATISPCKTDNKSPCMMSQSGVAHRVGGKYEFTP